VANLHYLKIYIVHNMYKYKFCRYGSYGALGRGELHLNRLVIYAMITDILGIVPTGRPSFVS
jgi:hypothetical protein